MMSIWSAFLLCIQPVLDTNQNVLTLIACLDYAGLGTTCIYVLGSCHFCHKDSGIKIQRYLVTQMICYLMHSKSCYLKN